MLKNKKKCTVTDSEWDYLGSQAGEGLVRVEGRDDTQTGWKLLRMINTCIILIVVLISQIYAYINIYKIFPFKNGQFFVYRLYFKRVKKQTNIYSGARPPSWLLAAWPWTGCLTSQCLQNEGGYSSNLLGNSHTVFRTLWAISMFVIIIYAALC